MSQLRIKELSDRLNKVYEEKYAIEKELSKLSKEYDENSPFEDKIDKIREEYYEWNIDGAVECARDDAYDRCREEANQPINNLIKWIIDCYGEGDSGYEEPELVLQARRLQEDMALYKTFKEAK